MSTLLKQALLDSAMEGYKSLTEHPVGNVATTIAGVVPGPHQVPLGITETAKHIHDGSYASAGISALGAGLATFIPGARTAAKGITSVLGKAAPKALSLATSDTGKAVGQIAGQVGAQLYDQNQAMKRPANQLAMEQQRQTAREFGQWQKEKAQMNQQAGQPGTSPEQAGMGVKAAAAALLDAPQTYGEGLGRTKARMNKLLPYIAAASIGANALPPVLHEGESDYGKAGIGALEGAAGAGGAYLGGMGGAALGGAVAPLLGKGVKPTHARNIGMATGAIGGSLLGYMGGRKIPRALLTNNDDEFRVKLSAFGPANPEPMDPIPLAPHEIPASGSANLPFETHAPAPTMMSKLKGKAGDYAQKGFNKLPTSVQKPMSWANTHRSWLGPAAAVTALAGAGLWAYGSGKSKRDAEDEHAQQALAAMGKKAMAAEFQQGLALLGR